MDLIKRGIEGAAVGVGIVVGFAVAWPRVWIDAEEISPGICLASIVLTSFLVVGMARVAARLPRRHLRALKITALVAGFAILASPIVAAAFRDWDIKLLGLSFMLPILAGLLGGVIVLLYESGVAVQVKADAQLRLMQDRPCRLPERSCNKTWLMVLWCHRGITVSVMLLLLILAWDVVLSGSFLMAFCFCPIWFLVSVLKNAIQRPSWKLALLRIAIPPLILGLVFANNKVQWWHAEANASRVVAACEEFHAANAKFPKTLDELVPQYLPSVPRAKYCMILGEFFYVSLGRTSVLSWYVVPPYGRKCYDFEKREWYCLD